MSAPASSFSMTPRPASVRRSSWILRFPRLYATKFGLYCPPRKLRKGSPCGGSTLITSAPRSASIRPVSGAVITVLSSTTRTPFKTSVTATPSLLSLFRRLRPHARIFLVGERLQGRHHFAGKQPDVFLGQIA